MILIKHINNLEKLLSGFRQKKLGIGFVPTMGALHAGHISLIKASTLQNRVTVCSIFVNPTQFNNTADFEKYPVTIERDIELLEAAGCEVLFLPSAAEMYPAGDAVKVYNLGYIETLLEGKYRPGHFQGVCRIVDKLLRMVAPDILYLGQKDYQQCMVINKMIELEEYTVKLEIRNTLREEDGLAMSSRNMRLSDDERKKAVHIIKTLTWVKQNLQPGNTDSIKQEAQNYLNSNGFKTDYIEIADATTLLPVTHWDGKQKTVALAAAYLSEIRLIDNLLLN